MILNLESVAEIVLTSNSQGLLTASYESVTGFEAAKVSPLLLVQSMTSILTGVVFKTIPDGLVMVKVLVIVASALNILVCNRRLHALYDETPEQLLVEYVGIFGELSM